MQNECHQWLSESFKVHQMSFWAGLRPEPRWQSLLCSPSPSCWFKEPSFKGNGNEGRGRGEEGERGKG